MAKGKYQRWLTKDGLTLIEGWKRSGLSDAQVAKNMGIAAGTLYDYMNKYPEISEAIKKGREVTVFEIENALIKRAKGYKYKEMKKEYEYGQVTKVTVIEKEVPPDTGAAAFALKNMAPEKWSDKKEVVGLTTVVIEGVNDLED